MNNIEIGSDMYWNTTGANNSNISLKCTVLDIGVKFIWIMVYGNLCPTPVDISKLSSFPEYKVTNARYEK